MERKKVKELPETNDEWWDEAEKIEVRPRELKLGSHHWYQKGQIAICDSCGVRHTMYLDRKHQVRDGMIVVVGS